MTISNLLHLIFNPVKIFVNPRIHPWEICMASIISKTSDANDTPMFVPKMVCQEWTTRIPAASISSSLPCTDLIVTDTHVHSVIRSLALLLRDHWDCCLPQCCLCPTICKGCSPSNNHGFLIFHHLFYIHPLIIIWQAHWMDIPGKCYILSKLNYCNIGVKCEGVPIRVVVDGNIHILNPIIHSGHIMFSESHSCRATRARAVKAVSTVSASMSEHQHITENP